MESLPGTDIERILSFLNVHDILSLASTSRSMRWKIFISYELVNKVAKLKEFLKGDRSLNLEKKLLLPTDQQARYKKYYEEFLSEREAFKAHQENTTVNCTIFKHSSDLVWIQTKSHSKLKIYERSQIIVAESNNKFRIRLTVIKLSIEANILDILGCYMNEREIPDEYFGNEVLKLSMDGNSALYGVQKYSIRKFFNNMIAVGEELFPGEIKNGLLNIETKKLFAVDSNQATLEGSLSYFYGSPGCGKTEFLLRAVTDEVVLGGNVLILVAQNSVADSIAVRLFTKIPNSLIYRMNSERHKMQIANTQMKNFCAMTLLDDKLMRPEEAGLMNSFEFRLRTRIIYNLRNSTKVQVKQIKQLTSYYRKHMHLLIPADDPFIVICTPASTINLPSGLQFSLVLVDEAEAVQNADLFIAATLVKLKGRLALIGDPNQLKPFKFDYNNTDLNIYSHAVNAGNGTCLSTQYRIVPEIHSKIHQAFQLETPVKYIFSRVSYKFRDGSHTKVIKHGIDDCVSGMECSENIAEGSSYVNNGEVEIISELIAKLPEMIPNFNINDLAVLSYYSSQKYLLSAKIDNRVTISTVDGFQGREMKIIILSLVRQNKSENFGFLADKNRAYTALTRACDIIIIVCGNMFFSSPNVPKFWKKIIQNF